MSALLVTAGVNLDGDCFSRPRLIDPGCKVGKVHATPRRIAIPNQRACRYSTTRKSSKAVSEDVRGYGVKLGATVDWSMAERLTGTAGVAGYYLFPVISAESTSSSGPGDTAYAAPR